MELYPSLAEGTALEMRQVAQATRGFESLQLRKIWQAVRPDSLFYYGPKNPGRIPCLKFTKIEEIFLKFY